MADSERASSSPIPFDADYYYMKALGYLASSAESGSGDLETGCRCAHYQSSSPELGVDKEIEELDESDLGEFAGFRPGLTRDHAHHHHHLHHASPGNDSGLGARPRCGSDATSHSSSSSGSASSHATSLSSSSSTSSVHPRRERKLSIGSKAYHNKAGSGDPHPKRKLSDGHVHWADEFQKDLARSHPRKTYSRHPSHHACHVKPILKPNAEPCEHCSH